MLYGGLIALSGWFVLAWIFCGLNMIQLGVEKQFTFRAVLKIFRRQSKLERDQEDTGIICHSFWCCLDFLWSRNVWVFCSICQACWRYMFPIYWLLSMSAAVIARRESFLVPSYSFLLCSIVCGGLQLFLTLSCLLLLIQSNALKSTGEILSIALFLWCSLG